MHYKNLELSDREKYQQIWEKCPQKTADYIFSNLFAWNKHHNFQLAFEGELVFIKANHCMRAPIGDWTKIDFTNIPLFQEKLTLCSVPEQLMNILKEQFKDKIETTEEEAGAEYIYKQEDLAYLKGNRFHKKKNHVNNFVKNYGVDYRPFDNKNLSDEEKDELIELCVNWCKANQCETNQTLVGELNGIKDILYSFDSFPCIKGGRLYYNEEGKDKLLAFSLGEKLDSQTFVVHFEKADTNYRAVFQAINKFFALNAAEDYEFVNREQDLGDEGLRQAKMSYHPVNFLKKYTITINP